VAPDRQRPVDAGGVGIATYEWGGEDAPPLFLVHGGFDFARTYDVFAPLLAAAGWRVVAWDQRGHGDSGHAELYSWDADLRDALNVMDTISADPIPVIGHSKGGAMMIQLADARSARFSHLVNLDGVPYKRAVPDVASHERTRMLAADVETWLDMRRRTADARRKPGTLDELAERRGKMNPRLSPEWLRYLASVGAREDEDGWRWKIDATMVMGGFGPWRPEGTVMRLPGLPMPFLAVLGAEMEAMGWGTEPEKVRPYLPPGGRLEILQGVGHFVHIEAPDHVAGLVLEHLRETPSMGRARGGSRRPSGSRPQVSDGGVGGGSGSADGAPERMEPHAGVRWLRHGKVRLALRELRSGAGRPLLLLHGLGEAAIRQPPAWTEPWPGAVIALDFTGHGASTVPRSGGYTAETLLADADAALAELGAATVVGRGLGAYVATMLAGARPGLVRGAVLADGPGIVGGGEDGPTPQAYFRLGEASVSPDPYALFELSRDLRPPDYATLFVRLAVAGSGLDEPLAVTATYRPAWLAAVAAEPGVADTTLTAALAAYSRIPDAPAGQAGGAEGRGSAAAS
jgi:pimeloyl-ACP methyl ester carboxylesterase